MLKLTIGLVLWFAIWLLAMILADHFKAQRTEAWKRQCVAEGGKLTGSDAYPLCVKFLP